MYTEKLINHFQNPHNVGVMEDADVIGEAGSPVCGDTTSIADDGIYHLAAPKIVEFKN